MGEYEPGMIATNYPNYINYTVSFWARDVAYIEFSKFIGQLNISAVLGVIFNIIKHSFFY